jgi:MFS family permease
MGGASLSLAFLHGSLVAVASASGVYGIGLGLIYAAITSVVVQSVPPTQTGIASGMNANLRTVGSAVGAAVMTALVTGAIAPDGLPAESGYTEGFATSGVLALAAGVVTVVAVGIMRAQASRSLQPSPAEILPADAARPATPVDAVDSDLDAAAELSLLPESAIAEAAEMARLAAKVESETDVLHRGRREQETLEVA